MFALWPPVNGSKGQVDGPMTRYLIRLSYGNAVQLYLDATKTGLYKAGSSRLPNKTW